MLSAVRVLILAAFSPGTGACVQTRAAYGTLPIICAKAVLGIAGHSVFVCDLPGGGGQSGACLDLPSR